MKYFILIFISLITLVIITSCGLIRTSSADKEKVRIADEYGGIYVFDKKLRDEIKQREKEREEYEKSRLETIEIEKEKLLRTFFTEKEIQDYRDMIERDKRRRGVVISYSYHPVYKKEQEIYKELKEKYPYSLIDKKFPQILSNGCKYFAKGLSVQEYERTDLSPYKEKIKEYTGEEAYNILHKGLSVSSYYVDKNNKVIPITFYTYIYDTITTYGLYGDEGAGFRLTNRYSVGIAGGNIFYLENGKFIKSDEIRKGERK